jgi:glutamate-1-semialdehyde 2,1-aminomutase
MDVVASSRVAHVGTFNANPICAAAAVAALTLLERDAAALYPDLERHCTRLVEIFEHEGMSAGLPLVVNSLGAAAHAFVSETKVRTFSQAAATDGDAYARFAEEMLAEGIHLINRGLLYVSTEHTDADLEVTSAAVARAAQRVAAGSTPEYASDNQ